MLAVQLSISCLAVTKCARQAVKVARLQDAQRVKKHRNFAKEVVPLNFAWLSPVIAFCLF